MSIFHQIIPDVQTAGMAWSQHNRNGSEYLHPFGRKQQAVFCQCHHPNPTRNVKISEQKNCFETPDGAANRTRLHLGAPGVEPPGGNSPPDCCIYMGSSPVAASKIRAPARGALIFGAANRTRTGTELPPADFKCYPLSLQ